MNLIITGHHLEVTPALEQRVSEKVSHALENFDKVLDVRVKLSIDNSKAKLQHAECTIAVKQDKLFVEAASTNMYATIDELVDKIQRQVIKYKEKHGPKRKDKDVIQFEM